MNPIPDLLDPRSSRFLHQIQLRIALQEKAKYDEELSLFQAQRLKNATGG